MRRFKDLSLDIEEFERYREMQKVYLSRTNFPSLYFWLLSCAATYWNVTSASVVLFCIYCKVVFKLHAHPVAAVLEQQLMADLNLNAADG
jgi:hypothetical protein